MWRHKKLFLQCQSQLPLLDEKIAFEKEKQQAIYT